jgi:diguanylate cyclase (GGDEF)-like protein
MLEGNGHEVITTSDGNEALKIIRNDETIDLVMTSFELPGLSGLQLCWEARLLAGQSRALYVIAMSSTFDARTLGEALDSGADDFITKPPDQQNLDARLRAAERLLAAQRRLIAWANRDPLTNLLNRRAFMADAVATLERVTIAHAPMVALILDIDHFKRVNDGFGHDVGDEVIVEVARHLNKALPGSGRLGGAEFAAIVENVTYEEAFERVDDLREAVANQSFTTANGVLRVTASIGVAELTSGDSIRTLLKRADLALYAAKQAGRNRVIGHASLATVSAVA